MLSHLEKVDGLGVLNFDRYEIYYEMEHSYFESLYDSVILLTSIVLKFFVTSFIPKQVFIFQWKNFN